MEQERMRLESDGHHKPKSRICTKDAEIESADKISQLPDEILVQIASFVPPSGRDLVYRDLVHLSAVSKTWYRVCTSMPIWRKLILNVSPEITPGIRRILDEIYGTFCDFGHVIRPPAA